MTDRPRDNHADLDSIRIRHRRDDVFDQSTKVKREARWRFGAMYRYSFEQPVVERGETAFESLSDE
jgi:hypothetical protein